MPAKLTDLAADGDNYVAVGELFRAVNIQLYVRFREEPWGKRVVRRVAGGVITLGAAAPPIERYRRLHGPT